MQDRITERSLIAHFVKRALAATLATLLVWETPISLALAQDMEEAPLYTELAPEAAGYVEDVAHISSAELDEAMSRYSGPIERPDGASHDPAERPDTITPIALPGGDTRSAVSSQAISLPSAEGSIEGMGESFAPVLSSGTATFTVPIAVAPGRGGVQPSLALSYSSSGGNGPLGVGWGAGVPFISRQTDRGLPRYVDRAAWHPEEDRFIYNGGQELVPVASGAMARIDQQAAGELDGNAAEVPDDVAGWQQYRARVEGGFMRFFRAPDSRRWVVQSKDGTRFDFGVMGPGEGPSEAIGASSLAVERDPESTVASPRVYRWMLTRMSDPHGSTVWYVHRQDGGMSYCDSIYYVSPDVCRGGTVDGAGPDFRRRCAAPLSAYGARVRLVWESRGDVWSAYTSGWRIDTALRLRRVEVTAHDDGIGARALVRRYHLAYDPASFHSQLASVRVEGRPLTGEHPEWGVEIGDRTFAESRLDERIVGALLPPMTFGYSALDRSGSDVIPGFGAFRPQVRDIVSAPPHSVDEARSDFFDVNSDGLPDLVVTDPARYRTASGEPAVGVFFNGFTGADTRPAAAGTFSGAVAMPMRSDLSGVLNLANLNVVPMDIDGDGRTDMLHMPRLRTYGWFAATRGADPAAALPYVRPAQQGWRWTYAEVTLPAADFDPRVDLGRDGQHITTLDVNNDHLVDVVRTTGTVMQTWLNLGWLPGGDGRFGSFTYSGSAVQLSTEPYESCLLHAGTPVDFEDPEVRFADMNGDGITDIARIRRGRVIYWPGRGLGSWGEGPSACARGAGAGRYIEVATPPAELNPELDGVQLADVDGDGAADVLQIGFDRVDVWMNRAGRSFTGRVTLRGTPPAPAFAPRTRLLDVDGSGTLDIVYASGDRWQYVDLLAPPDRSQGRRLRVLTSVDNGLGALTTLDYDSSARDYLADLAQCTTDECYSWGRVDGAASRRLRGDVARGVPRRAASGQPDSGMYHSAGSPVVSTVVRRVTTSDRLDALGREAQVSETLFAYHDGYYEGIEQEFRGFGAADAVTVGDADNPSVRTRTFFHQGRRPQEIADDRVAYSPDEALKGREFLTEVLSEEGVYQSSAHATLTSRTLAIGLDGRPIQYAFVSQADELRYDTTPFDASAEVVTLPAIVRETVDPVSGAVSAPVVESTRVMRVRGMRPAHIRTTYDVVDNMGHVRRQTAHGRIPIAGTMGSADEPISSVTEPALLPGTGWIWRTRSTYVESAGPIARLGESVSAFNAVGDLTVSAQLVSSSRSYAFGGEPATEGGAPPLTQLDEDVVASTAYDEWGSPIAQCAGGVIAGPAIVPECMRFGTVTYDAAYRHFATSETVHVARTGPDATLTTMGTWDRGLGVLLDATDPNALLTTMAYDGFGRITAVLPPPVAACEGAAPVPTTRIRYELTTSAATQPLSRVVTTTELDCDLVGEPDDSLVSIGYVDGLGRVRATLATGGDEHAWVRAGLSVLDKKGAVRRAWQPDFFDGADSSYRAVLALPGARIPSTRAAYDAFGRTIYSFAEDGALTVTDYHALSTDVCDPLDNDPGSMHFGTCTTARTDGFGRVIDQILRNRQPGGGGGTELHRLFTYYREDNAVLDLVRSETSVGVRPVLADAIDGGDPFVHRAFFFDSIGRRIGSDDPDTDDLTNADPATRTWRYLFNRVGDLVAVRDPRGCGQNFYYDVGGRLAGEAYVSCGEAQTSRADLPSESIAGLVGNTSSEPAVLLDTVYHYDADPSWAAALVPASASGRLGRATGVSDRGQRAAIAYDDRGNAIWTARQMAVIPDALALAPPPFEGGAVPVVLETAPAMGTTVAYDTAHTYVRTAAFDHAGRPTSMALPRDPDYGGAAPLVTGALSYDRRGLPSSASLAIDGVVHTVVDSIHYLRDGLVDEVRFGEGGLVLSTSSTYDDRRRPVRMAATRTPHDADPLERSLAGVTVVADQELVWDSSSNLVAVRDHRDPREWPAGHRPQSVEIEHDSLYRVVSAMFHYSQDDESLGSDVSSDWRSSQAEIRSAGADPMRGEPAPMVSSSPPTRVRSLTWEWDWLGNMVEWTDDAQSFYERSLGDIVNGRGLRASGVATDRPSALYLASNIPESGPAPSDGAGWVEVRYGVGGNVTSLTVHGECRDVSMGTCTDDPDLDRVTRADALRTGCECATEQHYEYRWDELDRIAEARRWDRDATLTSDWTFAVRQRYRYDGANVRTVKQTLDPDGTDERIALYVYAGDFERRGLVRGALTYEAADSPSRTETQYLVAGARLVWTSGEPPIGALDRDHRLTIPVSDLLQTTTGVIDLLSGDLLEVSTYYPNGARETLLLDSDGIERVASEPMGFTGKEADEEVGLVYFGERYLMARLARWASPDPLHVHASGGGEALNSYHYVSGSLLASRDPLGLDTEDEVVDALREIQGAVDHDAHNYAGTSSSGTELHGRVEERVRGRIASGDIRSRVGRRIVTEAVVDLQGRIVAHGAEGGPGAIARLRHSATLVAQLEREGLGEWVETTGSGARRIRAGYFRTVDQLVITSVSAGEIAQVRSGALSARGRVLALDTKYGRGALQRTADLRQRLGIRQVAVRPGGDLVGNIAAFGGRLGSALGRLGAVLEGLRNLVHIVGPLWATYELSQVPAQAQAIAAEELEAIQRGVDREVGVIADYDAMFADDCARSRECSSGGVHRSAADDEVFGTP